MILAHTAGGGGGFAHNVREFGWDWLPMAPLLVGALLVAALLVRAGAGDSRNLFARFGAGASRLTGYPGWAAAGAVALVGFALPMAALGFYWDVAWHIDMGRDEFLFSPPHVALLLGLVGIGIAGALSIAVATVTNADVGWQVRRLRVPVGAAGLVVAGLISQVGYFFDELWHWAYGLDVSMWGPTHLTMVSAAAFAPLSMWALLAEAGPVAGRNKVGRAIRAMVGVETIVALSAWQLEFDLGVPQWQALYHPVLIGMGAALGLTLCRMALGPGGALVSAVGAIAVRLLAGVVVDSLGLTRPRFPLYLAAALVVEVVVWAAERHRLSTVRTGVVAGLGVGTVGLAGDALWTQVYGMHPWTPTLLPGVWVAVVMAVACGVLGLAAGRVAAGRPSGVRPAVVALCFLAVVLAIVLPVFRRVPELTATIRTEPVSEGLVAVSVEVRPGAADDVDRFEVLSWQGGSSGRAPLREVRPGVYRAADPVPVGGTWKSMVHFVSRDQMGSIPVFMPADEAIDAPEIPVVAERTQAFTSLPRALQRESRAGGPAWPAVIAYMWVLLSVGGLIAAIVSPYVAVERRRRAGRWPSAPGSGVLEGKRIIVTGAAGGIGSNLVQALAANGAAVVGIDRRPGNGTVTADLTDPASAAAGVEEAVRRLGGRLDVLVNNAGIGTAGDTGSMPDSVARATVDVNLFGTWNTTAAAMPHLVASGGQVVNVASGLSLATVPFAAAYSASKRAVLGLTDVLRSEYRGRIRVSAVLPGYIRTAIHESPAAAGASLEGVVREEPVEAAVAAVVGVIESGRREVASSPPLAVELFFARHLPAVVEAVLRRRARRHGRLTLHPAADGRSESLAAAR